MADLRGRERHPCSLWINIPPCLSQLDLNFLNFVTQNVHIGADSDGLGHFFGLDLSGKTSLSIWKSVGQGANSAPFPRDGI